VGAQYLRDGDVVALEFTGVAGVVPFTVGGDRGVCGFDLESACAVAGSDEHRVPLGMPGRSRIARSLRTG
jgi:hypothetical protein